MDPARDLEPVDEGTPVPVSLAVTLLSALVSQQLDDLSRRVDRVLSDLHDVVDSDDQGLVAQVREEFEALETVTRSLLGSVTS